MTKTHTPARTSTSQHRLDAPDFERQPPGTIQRDFDALLDLIGDQGLPLTPRHLFAMKTLESINQRLTHPLELGLTRAMQKSYPHINGLYLVLRSSGLAWIDTASKKPRLHLDPVVLASWSSLNAAERYFALLKAWWGRSSEEIIGERESWGGDASMRVVTFLKRLPNTGHLTFETPQDADLLRYSPGLHHLALLDLFGLVELRAMPSAEGKGWQAEQVDLTEWGRALLGHFADFMHQQSQAPEAESDMPILDAVDFFDSLARFEHWSRLVRPHIPDWRQELEIPEPPFQPGQHLFKVSLGAGCWRRIAIGGETDLDTLADRILDAFDFDDRDPSIPLQLPGSFWRHHRDRSPLSGGRIRKHCRRGQGRRPPAVRGDADRFPIRLWRRLAIRTPRRVCERWTREPGASGFGSAWRGARAVRGLVAALDGRAVFRSSAEPAQPGGRFLLSAVSLGLLSMRLRSLVSITTGR